MKKELGPKTLSCIRCGRSIRDKYYTDEDHSRPTVMYLSPPHPIGPSCAKKWKALGATITMKEKKETNEPEK